MLDRTHFAAGAAVLAVLLLGTAPAFATVKCQCNNGSIAHDLSTDYDDPDADAACNDACEMAGGGRVWTPEQDDDDDSSDVGRHRDHAPAHPKHP